MRDGIAALGGDPDRVNPLQPVELVIDHSVQVDHFGAADSLQLNAELEYQRNRERYVFLRWGQKAFRNFRVVPPETGIVHQVNIEYLARVVVKDTTAARPLAYPDTVFGTDSHTTMVNGLGVVGWGVGGIEAEAAMLGQPISMLIPPVLGVPADGRAARRRDGDRPGADDHRSAAEERRRRQVRRVLRPGSEAPDDCRSRDARQHVSGIRRDGRDLPDRRHDARIPAAHGPRGRPDCARRSVRARAGPVPDRRHAGRRCTPTRWNWISATVEPSLAGPRRPQDRVPLKRAKASFATRAAGAAERHQEARRQPAPAEQPSPRPPPSDSNTAASSIAAITSCTNTSNPSVMIGAGLLAKKAVERGLTRKPWVKTSLAPGSKVVTEYLRKAGLQQYLDQLGFNLVGYGCTTCIGNSGPLPDEVSAEIRDHESRRRVRA